MSAEQIWNCPTAVVWQMMNQGSAQAKSDPNLRFMTPSARAEWDPAQDFRFRGIQFDDAYLETMRRRNEVYLRIIRILHEEGAPLLLGTDTPNPYVIPGFSIHRELVNLRAAGLSAFEALRCGTSEAARFVGETDEWGSIGIGKRADLLLMARNPLDDVAALQDLSHVFVNGYAFPRSALDELLVERARGVEQPPSFTSALEPIAGGPASASPHRAGTLRDVIAGAPGAEISYRHQLTEAGNILVEERTASGQRQAAGQVRTTSLELRPDGTIVRGTQHMTSPVGEELIEIQADRERGSVVRVQGIDGFRSETAFADPLIASERMSVTAFAIAVAATTDERPRAALTAERGEPRSVVAVVKNERAATADGPGIWRVTIDRVSELTEQTYRLAADGALVAVEELSPRGERRISPVER